MEYSYRDELYHHGILGQKWGKKNGPPYPLKESSHSKAEQKAGWKKSLGKDQTLSTKYSFNKEKAKRILIATTAIAGTGIGIYFAYKYGAVESIASLLGNGASMDECSEAMHAVANEMELIIPEGTMIHRMHGFPDYEPEDSYTFASYTDSDVAAYMTLLTDHAGTGERYDVALRAIKDLRVPSKQKALEVFNDLWDNEPGFKEDIVGLIKKTYEESVKYGVFTEEKVDSIITRDLKEDPLSVMSRALAIRSIQAQKYIDRLKKLGYDAVIDYYDQGIMADQPLIILDPKGSLQKFGEIYVTRELKLDRLSSLQKQGIIYFSAGNRSVEEVIKAIENYERL